MNVTLAVPCYNEEKRLDARAFGDALTAFPQLSLVLVNDGSRDATLARLQEFAQSHTRARVLDLGSNHGKAEAVRLGMRAALEGAPDLVGFWDADLATPLDEVPRFLDIFERFPRLDMVLGSRVKLMGRSITRRATRHYLGRVAATGISNVLGIAIYDTQCGAKMFRVREPLDEALGEPFVSRWIFDVELIARYIRYRGARGESVDDRIYELPLVTWRDVEGSNVKGRDFLRAATDLWKIERRYKPRGVSSAKRAL